VPRITPLLSLQRKKNTFKGKYSEFEL
jgi:hypothetical protein